MERVFESPLLVTSAYPPFSHQKPGLDFPGVISASSESRLAASFISSSRGACTAADFGIFLPCILVLIESRFAGQMMIFPGFFIASPGIQLVKRTFEVTFVFPGLEPRLPNRVGRVLMLQSPGRAEYREQRLS